MTYFVVLFNTSSLETLIWSGLTLYFCWVILHNYCYPGVHFPMKGWSCVKLMSYMFCLVGGFFRWGLYFRVCRSLKGWAAEINYGIQHFGFDFSSYLLIAHSHRKLIYKNSPSLLKQECDWIKQRGWQSSRPLTARLWCHLGPVLGQFLYFILLRIVLNNHKNDIHNLFLGTLFTSNEFL